MMAQDEDVDVEEVEALVGTVSQSVYDLRSQYIDSIIAAYLCATGWRLTSSGGRSAGRQARRSRTSI